VKFADTADKKVIKKFTEDWCQFLEGSMVQEFAHILYFLSVCNSDRRNAFIKTMSDYVFADRGGLNQSFMTHACALVVAKSETTAAYDQWGETLKRRRCGDDILLKCLSLASNADEFKALEQKFSAIKAAFEGKKIESRSRDLFKMLRALQVDFHKVEENMVVLGKHINNTSSQFNNVNTGFSQIGQKINSTKSLDA